MVGCIQVLDVKAALNMGSQRTLNEFVTTLTPGEVGE
jgi:hypothetical protein